MICLLSWRNFLGVLACIISLGFSDARSDEFSPSQIEFFEKQIRPIFVTHCHSCHSHSSEKLQAGLVIDRREGLIAGGDSGPSMVPGDAEASLLVAAIRYEEYEMPPKGKLADDEIKAIIDWVNHGAAWPTELMPESIADGSPKPPAFDLEQRKKDHWVWQPVRKPLIPQVANAAWPTNDIDHFILHGLESQPLSPAPTIDKRGLLRRLYFDLIGLPPTREQINAFLNDDSVDAVDTVIDQLLASTHFGERWGRHWLDLVRYSDSRGHEFDADIPNAYQYRDYVIRALNDDVPYDDFIREHLAGDLIKSPRLNREAGFNESILGTGFWFLGEWVHSPVDTRKDEADRFDNMIDVMSKTFLGVTVACARCHDHKFDAISTRDYYALSGFLQSSDYRQVPFQSLEHNRRLAEQLHSLDSDYRQRIALLVPQVTSEAAIQLFDPEAYRTLIDYANLPDEDFFQDGFFFGQQPILAGDGLLEIREGKPSMRVAGYSAARSDSIWDSLTNETERSTRGAGSLDYVHRSGRTLRTPNVELRTGNVFCEVVGSGQVVTCVDSHRLVSGPLHQETIVNFKAAESPANESRHWVRLKLARYEGKRVHLEFTPNKGESLAVLRVVEGDADAKAPPISQGVDRHVDSNELGLIASQWHSDREALKQLIQTSSPLAMAMMDGSSEDDHLLIRGSSANPGDVVPRRFLQAINGDAPLDSQTRSGRLELAERICDPENSLTARVIVNRVWHHLMGRGIVPTTDDFGVLGQRPTHPELLDHLATWFVEHGQSLKQTIRYIVKCKTYQMSSLVDANSLASDPTNVYWHYRPPKRLEAEVIRDGLLCVAGELDAKTFGPAVSIYLTGFMDGRGRPKDSGPLDGDRRRSIYITVRRNFVSPFMLAFDMPTPFSTMGRRNVSNVPAQALILMNDPFVSQQAAQWAKRELASVDHNLESSDMETLNRMYETAFARKPTDDEMAVTLAFIEEQSPVATSEDVWTQIAHSLINTKEFIFLR